MKLTSQTLLVTCLTPILVVVVDEVIEARLLYEEVLSSGPGGFFLQGQVHTLVAAILLGMPWLDAFDIDAQT